MNKFFLIFSILLALTAIGVTLSQIDIIILRICLRLGILWINPANPSIILGNCSNYTTVSQNRTYFQNLCYVQKIYYPYVAASDGKYYCVYGNITVTDTTPDLCGTSYLAHYNADKTNLTKNDLKWCEYKTAAAVVAANISPLPISVASYTSLIVSSNSDGYVLVGCPLLPFNLVPQYFTSIGMVCTYAQNASPAAVAALLALAPSNINVLQNLADVDQTGCPAIP